MGPVSQPPEAVPAQCLGPRTQAEAGQGSGFGQGLEGDRITSEALLHHRRVSAAQPQLPQHPPRINTATGPVFTDSLSQGGRAGLDTCLKCSLLSGIGLWPLSPLVQSLGPGHPWKMAVEALLEVRDAMCQT